MHIFFHSLTIQFSSASLPFFLFCLQTLSKHTHLFLSSNVSSPYLWTYNSCFDPSSTLGYNFFLTKCLFHTVPAMYCMYMNDDVTSLALALSLSFTYTVLTEAEALYTSITQSMPSIFLMSIPHFSMHATSQIFLTCLKNFYYSFFFFCARFGL